MSKFYHGIRRIGAVIVGLVFFVAGMLKLMDPTGTSLIVSEYFKFMHMDFAVPAAKVVGVALALLETLTGCALIAGIARRIVAIVTFCLLGFFSLVTLALVIFNPVMDCGCFGEAVHLTHAQSLMKNLALLVLAAFAFIPLQDGFEARSMKKWTFAFVAACVVAFSVYSLRNLPLVDFTSFNYGSQLLGDSPDEDRDGLEDMPVLSFSDVFGEYCDELAVQGNVLALSVYEPERLSAESWMALSAAASDALACGIRPLLLVPFVDGVPVDMGEYMYFADYKTLLTLNRSNGGATFISDGMIVDKWSSSSLPDGETLTSALCAEPVDRAASRISAGRLSAQVFLLASVAFLVLI